MRARSSQGAKAMLVRVGQCEAEVKVAALMSVPRLGFTDNFFCISQALAPHGIAPIKYTGAFFGQCLQMTMEQVVDTHDVVLTIDYDTIFTARTVEGLLALLMHSGYDAIAPLQTKRESNAVMFALPGIKPEDKTTVENDWFSKPVQPVETAHFGCTFIRTEAIKRMQKPWFIAEANAEGTFTGGHTDEDIYFWKKFSASGNKLGIATHVSVGHAELMITWPSRSAAEGKIQQHTTDFWNKQKTPPEEAWGFLN
jgi:hypothetical protein